MESKMENEMETMGYIGVILVPFTYFLTELQIVVPHIK